MVGDFKNNALLVESSPTSLELCEPSVGKRCDSLTRMAEAFKHLRFGAAAEEQRRQLKDEESKQLAKRAASGVNEAYIWGQGRPPRTCTVVRRNRRSAMV